MKDAKQQKVFLRPFTRRDFLSTSLKVGAAAFTTRLFPKRHVHAEGQYNVLFIIVDDLRPFLGCYGHPEMHTPNIDGLAQRGTLFDRAYCQYPICNPSRTSMITGLRPETTGVFNNSIDFRQKLPNAVTLPQHFKTHGYHTQAVGKILHNLSRQDDIYSWSVPSWGLRLPIRDHRILLGKLLTLKMMNSVVGKPAKRAVEVLEEIQNTQFFLAVGFHTPHLPLYAPKRYYELYKGENFSLSSSSIFPSNAPSIAGGNY